MSNQKGEDEERAAIGKRQRQALIVDINEQMYPTFKALDAMRKDGTLSHIDKEAIKVAQHILVNEALIAK